MWSIKNEDLTAWSKVESFGSVVQKLEEMASKKKQDEKNLKILRELVSTPCNKHCFDCQQRGPTYVNMTIGSFVCTTCSGLLRGLTPPHRVKSISMASFTDEEILLLKSRGNEYCKRVWLGLYDPATITDVSDESHVKDFMINKYERKRFYLDPSKVTMPVVSTSHQPPKAQSTPTQLAIPRTSVNHSNNNNHRQPDPFSPVTTAPPTALAPAQQDNFANFDNNLIFNAAAVNATPTKQQTSKLVSQDLDFLSSAFSSPPIQAFTPNQNYSWFSPWTSVQPMSTTSTPVMSNNSSPGQDRYAALKDLDCLMRASTSPSPWGGNGVATSVFETPQNNHNSSSSVFMSPESNVSSQTASPGNPFVVEQSTNNNPWGSPTPPSFPQPAAAANAFNITNPFETSSSNGIFGSSQAATNNTGWADFQDAPFGNQTAGFGTPDNNNKTWNFASNNFSNPFAQFNGATPAKSSNPFL